MHDLRELKNPSRFHRSDEFQKSQDIFFRKVVLPGFWGPGCHPDTLIDLANNAPADKSSVEPICMISEGYRTHGGVTGPMIFKSRTFFFEKACSRDFGAPGCHPSTLIYLVKTALANKSSVKPRCMISGGCRTHRGVTGPMNFKKGRFFSENRAPGVLGPVAAIQTP